MTQQPYDGVVGPCPWTCMAVAGISLAHFLGRARVIRRFRRELAKL